MPEPKMRNPWDSDDVKDPRDPDLADPFGGDIGPVKGEKPKAPSRKRTANPSAKRIRRKSA